MLYPSQGSPLSLEEDHSIVDERLASNDTKILVGIQETIQLRGDSQMNVVVDPFCHLSCTSIWHTHTCCAQTTLKLSASNTYWAYFASTAELQ